MTPILLLWLGCGGGGGGGGGSDVDRADGQAENLASSPGDFALDYVTADPYTRIVVEVDWVQGHRPSQSALDRLVATFEDLCDKPDGVVVVEDEEIPPQGSPTWSVGAAEDVEIAHRDRYRDAGTGTAVVYVLYLDGRSDADNGRTVTLAYGYHGSSVIVFDETLDDLDPGLPLVAPLEDVVLVHETGHLLGLVNNGVPMVEDHEDPEHPFHDANADCIMYWAIDTSLAVDMLLHHEPDFDDACRADLDAIR